MSPSWQEPRSGNLTLQVARKIAIAVVGFTLLGIGVAMIILPGPALLVIPLGLALLATEFVWARRWLQRLRNLIPSKSESPPEKLDADKHEKPNPP